MMNNTFTMLHDMEYLTLAGDKGKKEATWQFNMKLYSYEAVLQAANDFKGHCVVDISGNPHEALHVVLSPKPDVAQDANVEELGREFYNYTLGLMQTRGKWPT